MKKKTKKLNRYVDENTVNFVVMNKVGGFLQRIDYARKYAFGAMCILKDDKGQFPIRGAWIFRGQAIPPMMVEVRKIFFLSFFLAFFLSRNDRRKREKNSPFFHKKPNRSATTSTSTTGPRST